MKKVLSLLLAVVMVIGMLPLGLISASAAGEIVTYEKVTSAPADWSGTYLIVYEDEKMVLNGSLTNPDTASNYKTATISSNKSNSFVFIQNKRYFIE